MIQHYRYAKKNQAQGPKERLRLHLQTDAGGELNTITTASHESTSTILRHERQEDEKKRESKG